MAIKLDKISRRILFELDKNARIADTALAKIVGRSPESVRYRIQRLQEESIITGFTVWIDPTKIGYSSAKIYLTLANKPELKREFVKYVTKDKRLFWLGIAEGSWNAGLTYFVKSPREFFDLKNALFSKFKDLILESRTGTLVNVNTCDKTFFSQTDTAWKTAFENSELYELEEIEKRILKELFQNARINVVDIARKHKTTVDIVRARMKRLEQRRIIFRYAAKIDFGKLGYEFYKTFLYFKNLTKTDEARLMEYTRKQPRIVHLVKQISPWDIELASFCDTYSEYNTMMGNLTREFAAVINKVETAIMSEDYVYPSKQLIFE